MIFARRRVSSSFVARYCRGNKSGQQLCSFWFANESCRVSAPSSFRTIRVPAAGVSWECDSPHAARAVPFTRIDLLHNTHTCSNVSKRIRFALCLSCTQSVESFYILQLNFKCALYVMGVSRTGTSGPSTPYSQDIGQNLVSSHSSWLPLRLRVHHHSC